MERWRNSIHIAIRLWARGVFLRATSFASDERENVQNRSNIKNVPRNTHKPIFHAGMLVCQSFNVLANISQPINFKEKILESRYHFGSIGRRGYRLLFGRVRFCAGISLQAYIFDQAQCRYLAMEGKKQPKQLRNLNNSGLAILVRVRLGFNFVEPAQASIRCNLHRAEPR